MASLAGTFLIDAPASALNNAGVDRRRTNKNRTLNKYFVLDGKLVPYVSGQAVRHYYFRTYEDLLIASLGYEPYKNEYFLNDYSEFVRYVDGVFSEEILEYIRIVLLDLMGFFTAESGEKAKSRTSPISLSPAIGLPGSRIFTDFNVDSANSMIYEQQFYRAILQAIFKINMSKIGVYDMTREKWPFSPNYMQYYIEPMEERLRRVKLAIEAIFKLQGGAKQSSFATNIEPPVVIAAVLRGGNELFRRVIIVDEHGHVTLNTNYIPKILNEHSRELLSPVYIAWDSSYPQEYPRKAMELASRLKHDKIIFGEPLEVLNQIIKDLEANPGWLAPAFPHYLLYRKNGNKK